MVISPSSADVLAAIIARIRGQDGAVPLVPAYDPHRMRVEPPASAAVPAPHPDRRTARFSRRYIRKMLADAADAAPA